MSKEKGLSIQDQITITYQTEDVLLNDVLANFSQEINQAVLSVALTSGSISEPAEVKIDGRPIYLSIQTV